MTTKTHYAMLAVAMASVMGLAAAPTMQSAQASSTYWYYSFTDGDHTCIHGFPSSLNSATANSDGDLTGSADTDANNEFGQTTAFAYEERYMLANTSVDLTVYGVIDLDAQGGATNAIAYMAPVSSIYLVNGCMSNGSAVTGSIANLGSASGSNDQESGFRSDSSGSFTIPSNGYYAIVVYVDTNTYSNGTVDGELNNPSVKLVY